MLLCNMNPFIRFAQQIVYNPGGRFVCPGDSRIFYVLSGSGELTVQGTTAPMQEGTFVLINAGCPYRIASKMLLEMIVLNFDYDFQRADIQEYIAVCPLREGTGPAYTSREGIDDCCVLNSPVILSDMKIVEPGLRQILNVCTVQKIYFREQASSLLKQLLISVARATALPSTRASRTASQLIRYLQDHYAEEITSELLATQFNYHAYHINRIMRNATGSTVHKYLINYRISVSKTMLINTELSIERIALQVGFENAAYFSNTFRKLVGCSPSAFRRMRREFM